MPSGIITISNEVGPVKSGLVLFLSLSHTHLHRRGLTLFSGQLLRRISRVVVRVQPTSSVRVTSSTRCCPPAISPITCDHDDVFKLPDPSREAGSPFSYPVTTFSDHW